MEKVKRVKSIWMFGGGVAFLIGDLFAAKGSNWYNYIDNLAVLSMIIIGISYLRNPRKTDEWFNKALMIPVFLFNVSLIIIAYHYPGHTLNAISGMLLVLAMVTHNDSIPSWVFKYLYLSYSLIILYSILHEDAHYALLNTNPDQFYTQKYVNYAFFSASLLFLTMVSKAKEEEYVEVKNSLESVKKQDMDILNAILHNVKAPASIIAAKHNIAEISNQKNIPLESIGDSIQMLNAQLMRVDQFTKIINAKQFVTLSYLEGKLKKRVFSSCPVNIKGNPLANIPETIVFALESIIENSITFATLSNVQITESHGNVTIRIQDKGPGIPPEVFNKIGKDLIIKPNSFGLGLVLSHYMVKRRDWSIELGTKFNEGSCITLSNNPIPDRSKEGLFDLYQNV